MTFKQKKLIKYMCKLLGIKYTGEMENYDFQSADKFIKDHYNDFIEVAPKREQVSKQEAQVEAISLTEDDFNL